MKIIIKERFFNWETNKQELDIIEYTPCLNDAKEWAALKEDKSAWFCDLLGVSIDSLLDKPSIETKIQCEYLKLLGNDLAEEILENGLENTLNKYAIAGA